MIGNQLDRGPIDRSANLQLLLALNRVIFSSLEIREVLSAVARTAAEIVGAPFVSLWTADEATRMLHAAAASDEAKWADFPVKTMSFDLSVTGEVARTRRPVYVPDISADSRIRAEDWYRTHGLCSYYGTPVVFQDAVLGVLN